MPTPGRANGRDVLFVLYHVFIPYLELEAMSRLKDNLELCLDAVAYAKGKAPRSANQTYFKRTRSKKHKKRALFLLGMTRSSEYADMYTDDTETTTKIGVSPRRQERRETIEKLLRSGMSKDEVGKKLDKYIKEWGEDYFWEGRRYSQVKQYKLAVKDLSADHWWVRKILEVGGYTLNELKNMDKDQFSMAEAITDMRQSAANAAQSGIGNCDEKAQLAAEWIYLHTPGGRNLAMCYLDPEYGGVFGRVEYDDDGNPSGGGDHVFAVYDCNPTPGVDYDTYLGKIKDMGPNAIIVDGWMNDAYPAQHHSLSILGKNYRRNYNDEIINVKQSVVRDMNCISYRNHIRYRWNFTLAQGANHGDPKPDRKALSRGTDQYKSLVK